MDSIFSAEAEKQLEELSTAHEKAILDSINFVAENGFGESGDLKIIRDPQEGEIWRLKVKEGGRGGLDHRVFLDFEEDKLVVLAVFHRDEAYD